MPIRSINKPVFVADDINSLFFMIFII